MKNGKNERAKGFDTHELIYCGLQLHFNNSIQVQIPKDATELTMKLELVLWSRGRVDGLQKKGPRFDPPCETEIFILYHIRIY